MKLHVNLLILFLFSMLWFNSNYVSSHLNTHNDVQQELFAQRNILMHSVAHAKNPYLARGFYSEHTTNHYYLVNEIRKRATPSNTNPYIPPYITI